MRQIGEKAFSSRAEVKDLKRKDAHRQGKDRDYAEILNRLRTGDQTDSDIKILQERVRIDGDKDLPFNALYIAGTNRIVNKVNLARLEYMDGDTFKFEANVTRSGKPVTQPPKKSNDGSIYNTPLQFILEIKLGVRVMLTYNVDVLDSLSNGALGEVVGFVKNTNQSIRSILVKFDNPKVGKEKRKHNSAYLQTKYPNINVTPIEKMEF